MEVTNQWNQTPELLESLRSQNIVNVHPPLPASPRLKSRRNGMVCVWSEAMARRPEEYMNCDEQGNTDPRSWQGRFPEFYNPEAPDGQEPARPAIPPGALTPAGNPAVMPRPLEGLTVGIPEGY
jgi:hypothetical protein